MNAPDSTNASLRHGRRDPPRSIPRATYRLQLHRGFGFREARRALPYLAELGVSHVYCSPYLMATPGSTHGYDVVDPTRLNPDLGSLADYREFLQALESHGLRQILDIVPNHMGVDTDANPYWQHVLRHGRASVHASWFDIDWTRGRLLLPILGAPLYQVIDGGELTLALEAEPGLHAVGPGHRIDLAEAEVLRGRRPRVDRPQLVPAAPVGEEEGAPTPVGPVPRVGHRLRAGRRQGGPGMEHDLVPGAVEGEQREAAVGTGGEIQLPADVVGVGPELGPPVPTRAVADPSRTPLL